MVWRGKDNTSSTILGPSKFSRKQLGKLMNIELQQGQSSKDNKTAGMNSAAETDREDRMRLIL